MLKLYIYIYIKTTNNFLTNSSKIPTQVMFEVCFFSFPKDGHLRPSATWPPGPAAKRRGRTVGRNPSGWGLGETATTVGQNGHLRGPPSMPPFLDLRKVNNSLICLNIMPNRKTRKVNNSWGHLVLHCALVALWTDPPCNCLCVHGQDLGSN